MTLLQLQYFRTLARVQHFTKAAAELMISQPSLSYSISQLEKELNTPLFNKQGKKITITKGGELFLKYVEKSLDSLEDGRKELELLLGSPKGTIDLGYIHSVGHSVLPVIVKNFYNDPSNTEIQIHFMENTSKNIIENLKNGNIDLAFCVDPLDPMIESVPLFVQELILIVYKDHPLANRKQVNLEEIANETFIFADKNNSLRSLVDDVFKTLKVEPHIGFEAGECNAIIAFVGAKLGIAIIPSLPAIDEDKVSIIKINSPLCRRNICLALAKNKDQSFPVKKFKDYIIEYSKLYDKVQLNSDGVFTSPEF